ncbi:MAG: AbrB/MazE/SpoVT family DNA-binding domain-containing protein [Deltaproteobacteria bacterium]|nr:AbrB/MazE/SpoVT family DNA-binding domain-containing protein [Deltaproteobacteria bacterium]
MKQIAIVGEKGQVTIPKALRKSLGIHRGTELRFEEHAGLLIVRRIDSQDQMATLVGLGGQNDSDALLTQLRGPAWEHDLDDGK